MNPRVYVDTSFLEPVTLRSLDALHLATALGIYSDIEYFLTYDVRLADAARHVGFHVVSPGLAKP